MFVYIRLQACGFSTTVAKSKIPVYCCSSRSSSLGSVNSTVITNIASLISQPGFSFVKCNFAVDFWCLYSVYVCRAKTKEENSSVTEEKIQQCESVWCIKTCFT